MSSTILNSRKFTVAGRIDASFTPESTESLVKISNLEVELWQKSPLDIFFLGKGTTNDEGDFQITFTVNDEPKYLFEGSIENVFAKVYYQGVLVSGGNPYAEDEPSLRPIKDIVLKEGYTNIGSYTVPITTFEFPINTSIILNAEKETTARNSILFKINERGGDQRPLPAGCGVDFTGLIGSVTPKSLFTSSQLTTTEGYAELIVPQLPVSVKSSEEFVVNTTINGVPSLPSENVYWKVATPDLSKVLYTMNSNLTIRDGRLCVCGNGEYYPTALTPIGLDNVTRIGIDPDGTLFMYDEVLDQWTTYSPLTFYQFQYPENLTLFADGMYEAGDSAGLVTSGHLGNDGSFSKFSISVDNPGTFPIDVELFIFDPSDNEVFSDTISSLLPGSKNFVQVATLPFKEAIPYSPSIEEIETISGVTFSVDLVDFLGDEGLDTLDSLKKAGPIRYIDGLPTATESELTLLQAHIDLYTVNTNAIQNQDIIDKGYDNLSKIAETSKETFISDVESAGFTLYDAAKLHNTVVQNQKLLSNLLSAKMGDYALKTPSIPDLPNSNFASTAFSKFINRCECEDCTSAVSPFSYLVDLLKYGAKNIKKTGSPSYTPVNYNAFLTLLEGYFFQPFGSFSVDCDTLHKEYCRLRLVTEILEQYVATKTLPTEVLERLENDRKNFLLLTYKTILTQAGSSYEELRSVITMQDEDDKKEAAQRLSDKLGIPLYIPGTIDDFTADRMWLTFDNTLTDQELTAENLEIIYGFRDTERNVLTNPTESLMITWKNAYLRELWKSADFFFSEYSREGVKPEDDLTFKANWKPIIDPDMIGRGDMTYKSSDFALDLWRHRKEDTDTFLNNFVTDVPGEIPILSRTSVDLSSRILRVPGINLSGTNFYGNSVRIKNPDTLDFDPFPIFSVQLNGANTDIILKKSTPNAIQPSLFQPAGNNPVMRYDNALNLTSAPQINDDTWIFLEWAEPVIINQVPGVTTNAKLISSGSNDVYSTFPEDMDYLMDEFGVSPDKKKVNFAVTTPLSAEFLSGNITFIYEAQVALDTTTSPDPSDICDKLFGVNSSYTYLDPAIASAFTYSVWDAPVAPEDWPAPIASESGYYNKLKKLYEIIRSGDPDPIYMQLVTENLHTDAFGFNQLMENLLVYEQFLNSMYLVEKPELSKLYQTASILRNCARTKLDALWVKEEIKYIPTGGTDPEKLMLDARFFWKALNEPASDSWDPSLQTIPGDVADMNASSIAIIDPELVPRNQLLISPDAKPYVELYDDRKQQLDDKRSEYFSLLSSFEADSFLRIFNEINTGSQSTPYDIDPPYTGITQLIAAFQSNDAFVKQQAIEVLSEAFALTPDEFSLIIPVMQAYEDSDPSNQPTIAELRSVTDLLVTACKRKQFYLTDNLHPAWIPQEIDGTVDFGPVKYYNVLQLRMDSLRGNSQDRSLWQQTLARWNRVPTVFPDIVPPENIKEFIIGEAVHDLWISRKNALDSTYSGLALLFNDSLNFEDLFANYKETFLDHLVARANVSTATEYYNYFVELFEKEDSGEDIRPYLNQLNIRISEYRVLREIYTVLENGADAAPTDLSNLLPSEFESVINIFIRIQTSNSQYFALVEQEYLNNIVLTGADFQNYTPAIINFPINLVQETEQWRSPNADKKAWKDTLNSRIERKEKVTEEWNGVIEATEDIALPVMRDALIQALRNNCESFDDAAERIAKTLFIETKDNCCVKHSRVSHAIETIQGLIFALESGVYDNYLTGFSLTAPNFDKEWQWLGSYATWRSAVFTYIYPENLLYPTLKRKQSPAFIELADTIQNANRFSPIDACKAAKKYQTYFEDIQNLKLICTANTDAYIFRKDPLDCCGDLNNSMREYMTFYFGQSTLTDKVYYSSKAFYATDPNEHDFWIEIPIREKATVLGCLPLSSEFDDNGKATDAALWLFYTFKEDGEFKLAYLKKDLMTAGSEWTEEETMELPDLTEVTYSDAYQGIQGPFSSSPDTINYSLLNNLDILTQITVCQHSTEWDFVNFILSYKRWNGTMRHIVIRYMPKDDFFDTNIGNMILVEKNELPITGVVHDITTTVVNLNSKTGITVVFNNEIRTGYFGSLSGSVPIIPVSRFIQGIAGVFKKDLSEEKFIIANRNNSGLTTYQEVYFDYSISPYTLEMHEEILTAQGFDQNILSIAPRFNSSNWESANAVTVYNKDILSGTTFRINGTSIGSALVFALALVKSTTVQIESGNCIENFDLRTANIKLHMRANLNAPQGNPIGSLYRTSGIRDVLYEAYYFVPMLIALDQQQRGDYPTALDWYQSVYDYTNNLNHKRKIFYGLVLEESITNVFDRPSDWLMDPLNPHLIAQTRTNAYTKYTLMNIIQCMTAYGDREFTIDTIETVPNARKLYTEVLDLLKVSELNVKPSQCYTSSHACFQTAVETPIDFYWANMFAEVQSELESLNDAALIEEASEYLVGIFNGELETEAKFTNAFDYLKDFKNTHPAPAADSVTELMDGISNRMNDAYRYLFADVDTQVFNNVVVSHFTNTLATLASSTPDQVGLPENSTQISWLLDAVPDNAQSLAFRFADDAGVQLLKNPDFAYNPFQPTPAALQGNLVFGNASVLYQPFLYAEDYVPFVDYAFCLPTNPVYQALELKANLELFKIHNCRNIAGMERTLDIFAAPTDSVSGVPVIGAGGNLILPGTATLNPSQYRFRVLIERAKQLVSQAQQLESQFLSTLEKEDAENYSQLRAKQDLQTAKSTVKLQDLRVKQALNEETVADLQLDKVQFIRSNYDNWINAGLNGYETASLALLTAATIAQTISSIAFFSAGAYSAAQLDGKNAFGFSAQGTAGISQVLSMTSSMMSQLASYQRRSQEWQFQSELAGYDISIANQQIKIAEQNTRIVSQEREIASMNMDHATDTLEFLKTKFTNAELYRWMGNVLERTYSYMLNIATAVARTAEQQYYFEQQEQAGPFILNDYWEVPQTGALALTGGGIDRRGLTGSTRLLQDLTRLDQYAFETTKRKLQMTKIISLGQNFPDAFQTFRETGVLNFDLTNRLFDYDFPGHYLRLINGVKVSVIGLVPVYDNIKATLTAGTTSYTVIESNNTFQRIPIRRMETDQVALTGASRATGLFELQPMQNEFLNPFEGMGIESHWELKMPKFSNRMDFSQIADVVIEVDYTALDSYQYRFQVLQDIDNTLGFSRGFSFKNDFPDQWYELAQAQEGNTSFYVDIELKPEMFPAGVDNIRLDGSNVLLHFARKDGFTDEVSIADFSLVSSSANSQPMTGITVDGTFSANALTNVLSTQNPATPFVKLRLAFANTPINRELFSEENVTDILLLVSCKADLPVYPL
ncbi:neuraminidase-like domain-containing protein [uncultured Fluviicola sp.]|uniref:Tc toxin subunit A-related protein n=1 Tax=uncultured Fluviicola sp. TaxID=463303 RepID=UPI0025E9CA9C|nr:neuraminidase-like domain-containing protein [uncultured Fluviicola sp.]